MSTCCVITTAMAILTGARCRLLRIRDRLRVQHSSAVSAGAAAARSHRPGVPHVPYRRCLFSPRHAPDRARSSPWTNSYDPPIDDGAGGLQYFSSPRRPGDTSPTVIRALRRDLLTSVAAVLRECRASHPSVVLGSGQGGLVALACAYPRVAEAALASRCAREDEGRCVAEAWRDIHTFVVIGPRFSSPSRSGLLESAVPELFKATCGEERPAPLVFVPSSGPHAEFQRELRSLLKLEPHRVVSDGLALAQLLVPKRPAEFSGGRCACGRASLLLSRCGQCVRADAELAAEARSDDYGQGVPGDSLDEREKSQSPPPSHPEAAGVCPEHRSCSGRQSHSALGQGWLPGPARRVQPRVILAGAEVASRTGAA